MIQFNFILYNVQWVWVTLQQKKKKVYRGINMNEIFFCYQKQWDYFYNKHTLPNVQSYVN
jgi:hypothetical protein